MLMIGALYHVGVLYVMRAIVKITISILISQVLDVLVAMGIIKSARFLRQVVAFSELHNIDTRVNQRDILL